jgi:hypothetical protein
MENYFATGSLAGVFKFPYRLVLRSLFKCVADSLETPRGSTKPNLRSFPQIKQYPQRRKGRRGLPAARLLGEVAEGVGDVLRDTAMCGSPSGMVGVCRSTCAGGGARRRQGVRPIQGKIDQTNESESFTRDQGRCVCEELKNDSSDCSVYARMWAGEIR